MDSREAFEKWANAAVMVANAESMADEEVIPTWPVFCVERSPELYPELTVGAVRAWHASRQAIECEPVAWLTSKGEEKEVIFDSEYDRNDRNHDEKRGWKYDPLFTHAQSAECDCCGYPGHDLPKWRKILREAAQPASAVPNAEYIRALQDACDIIQADANTEENYGSLCRIGSVLAKLKAGPTRADDRISVHEYTARSSLEALKFYTEWMQRNACGDPEPIEHFYAMQAIEEIESLLPEPTYKEQGE